MSQSAPTQDQPFTSANSPSLYSETDGKKSQSDQSQTLQLREERLTDLSGAFLNQFQPELRLLGPKDRIFQGSRGTAYPLPFEFNEEVANVFDDMVTRSVPLYRDVIDTLLYWVHRFYQPSSVIYDLGCSTGTTIDVLAQMLEPGARFVGIDNSRPMIHRATAKLSWAAQEKHEITLECADINQCDIHDASVVIMNYTLQFIPYSQRRRLLKRIYNGLRPGSILFLSEKIRAGTPVLQETVTWIYEDFKHRRGYSLTEIARKKEALENVLVPLTEDELREMLSSVGFGSTELIAKWNNFSTFVAYKAEEGSSAQQQKKIKGKSDETQKSDATEGGNKQLKAVSHSSVSNSGSGDVDLEPNPINKLVPWSLDQFFDDDPDYLYRLLPFEAVQTLRRVRRQMYAEKRNRFKSLEAAAECLLKIPDFATNHLVCDNGLVEIGDPAEFSEKNGSHPEHLAVYQQALKELMPWKKGPFKLFGTEIDSEWRSDWKWARLQPHISSLEGKVVADVGCANGYFMYRMLEHKPKLVFGLDPNVKAWMEFQLLQRYAKQRALQFEILTVEQMDLLPRCFDTIFCLGVLYHCSDPIGMLRKMFVSLKPGGEIFVDCQGIPGDLPLSLVPRKTYAKAKGIWFLPTTACLENWLLRANYQDIQCVYDEPLATEEQRATAWAPINSLAEFLDPENPDKTVEGYPAPRRIYMKAKRP